MSDGSIIEANASFDSLVEQEEADPDTNALKSYQQGYHDFKTGKKRRKYLNQTHVSQTDPDATMVSREGYHKKLCHKVHYSIDADSRMIADRIDYHIKILNLSPTEWIADKGYGRGPTYAHLRDKGIRGYIPLYDVTMGRGVINRGEFSYERPKDRYRCPQGFYLYPSELVQFIKLFCTNLNL